MNARKYATLALLIVVIAVIFFYLLHPGTEILWSRHLTISPAFALVQPMALDEQSLYIAGGGVSEHPIHPAFNTEWRIEKRNLSDGSLITDFGSQGIVTSSAVGRIRGIVREAEDIYAVGDDWNSHYSGWRIEKRRSLDGSLVPEFGTGGVIKVEGDRYESLHPNAIVADKDDIIIAGSWSIGLPQYVERGRLEKRRKDDGSLVPEFGNQGVILIDSQRIEAMAADDSYFYIAAVDLSRGNGDPSWHIDKRALNDGTLVPSFGLNGIISVNPTPDNDHIQAIALGGEYLYVVGFSAVSGMVNWRIEKRHISDGSLVDTFGTGGVITSSKMRGYAWPMTIAVDPRSQESFYVAGRVTVGETNDQMWQIDKRRTSDGSLITRFGNDGVVTYNPSDRNAEGALGVVIRDDMLYVVGQDNSEVVPGKVGGWKAILLKIRI